MQLLFQLLIQLKHHSNDVYNLTLEIMLLPSLKQHNKIVENVWEDMILAMLIWTADISEF